MNTHKNLRDLVQVCENAHSASRNAQNLANSFEI